MFIWYITVSLTICMLNFIVRNNTFRIVLLCLFLTSQTLITLYASFHINEEIMGYFKYDSLGLIFMIVLTFLGYTTVYHSYIYLQHRKDDNRKQRIYFSALMLLILAMSCVYFSSHLGPRNAPRHAPW